MDRRLARVAGAEISTVAWDPPRGVYLIHDTGRRARPRRRSLFSQALPWLLIAVGVGLLATMWRL